MKVAYVTPAALNTPSAGLARVIGVSRGLAFAGHRVAIGGQGSRGDGWDAGPGVSLTPYGAGLAPFAAGRRPRLRRASGVSDWLSGLPEKPDLVIVYGGSGPFTRAVRSWTGRHGVKRVIDSVEWYDRSHMTGGAWGPRALDNELSMRWRYPRYDGAIAISRFLEEHYRSRGREVLRVPPITDVESFPSTVSDGEGPLRLLYAGTPGKKDELLTVMQAVEDVDPDGLLLRLDVLGPEEDEIASLVGGVDSIPAAVVVHGRVSREHVLHQLSRADYVPLLRPSQRYAEAGFPTKVVEAMASGTAVIANLTSDLSLHLREGETGIVVASNSRSDMAAALTVAIEGGRTTSRALGVRAREEAMRSFDFRNYSAALSSFAERVHG